MPSWQLMAAEKLEDSDIEPAPKLIEAVLQNCRGRVDQWLEPYLRISIERLRKTRKNYLKDLLVNVIANGLYYNAPMCLTILQHLGVTSEIFQSWFQMLYEVKKSGKPLHFVRYYLILLQCLVLWLFGVWLLLLNLGTSNYDFHVRPGSLTIYFGSLGSTTRRFVF